MNLSTVRRTETELSAAVESGALEGRVVHVRDRFGDYGLVGLLLFRIDGAELVVDTMLLSCRAMGRGVEHAMLREAASVAAARGLAFVLIQYSQTRKNMPARALLESLLGSAVVEGGSRVASAELAKFEFKPNVSRPAPGTGEMVAPAAAVAHGDYAAIAALRGDPERLLAAMRVTRGVAFEGTPTEQGIAAIWAGMLPITKLAVDDDFFDLGGHSLLAVQLLTRIREMFGVELSLDLVYSDKLTVRRLAAIIDNGGTVPDDESGVLSDEEYAALLAEVEGLSDEEVQALLGDA